MSDATNQTTANLSAKTKIIPAELGAELDKAKAAHKEVMKALGKGCEAAMEAGEALNRIKAAVPHGQFMDYVEDVCDIPGRTARRYMWLADQKSLLEQRLGGKMANLATLTQTEVVRMIGSLKGGKQAKPRAVKPDPVPTFETLKADWFKASEDVRRRFREVVLARAA
jgi:hypothetical protein